MRKPGLNAAVLGFIATLLLSACGTGSAPQSSALQAGGLFQCLDGNANDYLEAGELQNTTGCDLQPILARRDFPDANKRRAEAMITAMDADGDQRISEREFQAWFNR